MQLSLSVFFSILFAMQALGKKVHVSKAKFVNEIKQHRNVYAEQETDFNTWKAPNGEIYLVPEFRNKNKQSDEQLGYALSMSEDDELAQQSLVAVKEENLTALGFPIFWHTPCEEEEEEEEPQPRKITIILDGIDATMETGEEAKAENNNLKFVGLENEDSDKLVTETLVQQITLNSTITSIHKKTLAYAGTGIFVLNVTDIPTAASTLTTPATTLTTPPISSNADTWETSKISRSLTLGFGLTNDTDTVQNNSSVPGSNSTHSTFSPQTIADQTESANEAFNALPELYHSLFGAAVLLASIVLMA